MRWRAPLLLLLMTAGPASATISATGALDLDARVLYLQKDAPRGATFALDADVAMVEGAETTTPRTFLKSDSPIMRYDVHLDATAWMESNPFLLRPTGGAPRIRSEVAGFNAEKEMRNCIGDSTLYPACTSTMHGGRLQVNQAGFIVAAGNFELILYGWNGTLDHKDGREAVWSGSAPSSPIVGLAVVPTDRQVKLTLQNATLAFGFDALDGADFLAGPLTLKGTGSVWVDSRPTAELKPGVSLGIDFEERTPRLTHLLVQPDAEAQAAESSTWWPLALALVAGFGVCGVILYLVLRPKDPILRALHTKNPSKAARLAAIAAPATSAQESAVRAVAFIQAGQYEEAERQLGAYALPDADHLFVMATLRAKQGRDDEARALLRDCVQLNQAYVVEARLNADLARLCPEPSPAEGYS